MTQGGSGFTSLGRANEKSTSMVPSCSLVGMCIRYQQNNISEEFRREIPCIYRICNMLTCCAAISRICKVDPFNVAGVTVLPVYNVVGVNIPRPRAIFPRKYGPRLGNPNLNPNFLRGCLLSKGGPYFLGTPGLY